MEICYYDKIILFFGDILDKIYKSRINKITFCQKFKANKSLQAYCPLRNLN